MEKAIMQMVERVSQDIDPTYDYTKDNYFTYVPEKMIKSHTIVEITSAIF